MSPTIARDAIDIDFVESISLQIEQALYRLRLAKPAPGLWVGISAQTLTTTLASVESELLALKQFLSW